MSITNNKGSAGVEMVYAIILFLSLIIIVHLFSELSNKSHSLSLLLQNRVEKKMIDAGRPPCLLEAVGEKIIREKIAPAIFGRGEIRKGLLVITEPICGNGEI